MILKAQTDAIHDFSLLPRTGSIPAEINRFINHTGKFFNSLKKSLTVNISLEVSKRLHMSEKILNDFFTNGLYYQGGRGHWASNDSGTQKETSYFIQEIWVLLLSLNQ